LCDECSLLVIILVAWWDRAGASFWIIRVINIQRVSLNGCLREVVLEGGKSFPLGVLCPGWRSEAVAGRHC
jgi:hypothetical protein